MKKDSIKIISICATHPGINYFYEQNNAYINLEKTAFVLSNVERKEWQIKNCNKKNITIIFNNIKGAMFIYSTGVIQIMGASSIEDVNIMFNEHHNLIPNFIMTNVVKRRKRKIRDIYITPLSFPLIDDELLDELCYELGI